MLRIRLLGLFEVERDGEPIAGRAWRSQKAKTLLKILLTHAGHPVPRDRLLEWVWPATLPADALNTLQVNIALLRKLLEPAGARAPANVLSVGQAYMFAPTGAWIDAEAFRRHVADGRRFQEYGQLTLAMEAYREATTLYRGEYLEEDAYEEWAITEREHLLSSYTDVQTRLADLYFQLGMYREAAEAAETVLRKDRCYEAAYRQLMACQYLAGNQAAALRAYERCLQALRDELDVEPSPATTAIYEQIRDGSFRTTVAGPLEPVAALRPPVPAPAAPQFPFVGRQQELAALGQALERAREGVAVVAVTGAAGVGKTTLMRRFVEVARPATVLWTQAYEVDRELPLQAFKALLRHDLLRLDEVSLRMAVGTWGSVLVRHLPELRSRLPDLPTIHPLPAEEERAVLLDALAGVLAARALAGPSVLVLEDIHWADSLTLQCLHRLAASRPGTPLLIVLTARHEELTEGHPATQFVRKAQAGGPAGLLTLSPLTPEEIGVLLRERGIPDPPPPFVEALHRKSGGNPLFLTQFIQDLAERKLIGADPDGASLRSGVLQALDETLPAATRATILERVDRLQPLAREALGVAVALEGPLEPPVWAAAVGLPEADLAPAVTELTTRGFVRHYRDALTMAHDVIQQTVYEALPGHVRRTMHHRVAEALRQTYPDMPDRVRGALARHYERAGEPGRAIVEWGQVLQRAARVHARDEVLAVGAVVERLAPGCDDGLAFEQLRLAAEAYNRVGAFPEEVRVAAALREIAARLYSGEALVAANLISSRSASLSGARADAVIYLDEAWKWIGLGKGTVEQRAEATMVRGLFAMEQGRTDEARAYLTQSLAEYQQLGEGDPLLMVYDTLAWERGRRGHWDEALAHNQAELVLAERLGRIDFMARAAWNMSGHALRAGDVVLAQEMAEKALSWAKAGGGPLYVATALFELVDVSLYFGDTVKARTLLEEYQHPILKHPRHDVRARWYYWRGRTELQDSDVRAALSHFDESRRLCEQHPDPYFPMWQAEIAVAEARLAGGDLDGAGQAADGVLAHARSDVVRGLSLRIQGMTRAGHGQWRAADQSFRESVDLLTRTHRTIEAARTTAAHGRALLGRQPRRARRLLREALGDFRRLHAIYEAKQVESLLTRSRPSPSA